jgi:hypothetical protein
MTVADALVPMTFFISVAAIFISRSEIVLRHELGETQERLDFAERLLAKGGSAGQLS